MRDRAVSGTICRMAPRTSALLVVAWAGLAAAGSGAEVSRRLDLPGGAAGIGFDDLGWSPELGRVLVPGGRTGKLFVIDPATGQVDAVEGFTHSDTFSGGHGEGTTSVDTDGAHLFASDRGRQELVVADAKTRAITARTALAGRPDYVRWVATRTEVWVTEPKLKQIEVFSFSAGKLARVAVIQVPGGPESLVIDVARGRAYTHTWTTETVALSLATHLEVARWKNGCEKSRGIALDAARGWLFVGCEEGKASALNVATGKPLGAVATGKGVDIIAYAPKLRHLYVPGADDATLTLIGVGNDGALHTLGSIAVAKDASCVTVDDGANAYVCDPTHGRLWVVHDAFPASE